VANASKRDQPPRAVKLIRAELNKLLRQPDPSRPGNVIGTAKTGVYAFFDYDNEPIYVGQTSSSFSDRISRHLTGQRSDAVAKFILDPFEVAFVSMWSIPDIVTAEMPSSWSKQAAAYRRQLLEPYEFTVYKRLEAASRFHAVLNEGIIKATALTELPESVHGRIIPAELWEDRKHPDVRIARRASTISRLSQMVSEREVSAGMRRTLLLQARRLEWLTENRVRELGIERPSPGEMLDDLLDEDM
jgi:hypothetical protein